jgi:hypothetical protein
MKILEEKYPMGTLKGQKSPGRYIDGTLYQNLEVLARNINKDLTYLGIICSSTYEVGAGKSTLLQQMGEAWSFLVNKYQGTNIDFSLKNLVWKPKELIERSFQVPKYSLVGLDEWEELNYWSELGMSLRQFFRKCRQLNLFIIIICPNFFQLNLSYAVSRSNFLIDVQFKGEFDRGYFRFFNFEQKKQLFIKGKKFQDYYAAKPNFIGRFVGGYVLDEEEYRAAKRKDMEEADEKKKPEVNERAIKIMLFKQIYENLKLEIPISIPILARAFKIGDKTADTWLNKARAAEKRLYNNNLSVTDNDIDVPDPGQEEAIN